MTSASESENQTKSLLDSGDVQGAIHKYNLASKLYQSDNDAKAIETRLLSKLLSANMKASEGVTESEYLSSISDFEEVRKIVVQVGGKQNEALREFISGLILTVKASIENVNGRSDSAIEMLQESEKILAIVEDKFPHIVAHAENHRLVVSFMVHLIRAMTAAAKGKQAIFQINRAAAFKGLQKLNDRGQFTDLLAIQLELADSIMPFNEGLSLLIQNKREARQKIIESGKKMTLVIRQWEKKRRNVKEKFYAHSGEIIIQGIRGISQTANGLASFVAGETALYQGDVIGARKGFVKALEIMKSSAENVASLGDYSKELLEGIELYEKRSTFYLNNMADQGPGVRRRFGLSAGKQFGLLFTVSFSSFIGLRIIGLLDVSGETILSYSLIVSLVSVFGLNATKLFNILSVKR